MNALRLSAVLALLAFVAGTYVGASMAERRIVTQCLMGERMQIASIEARCPSVPGWREQR